MGNSTSNAYDSQQNIAEDQDSLYAQNYRHSLPATPTTPTTASSPTRFSLPSERRPSLTGNGPSFPNGSPTIRVAAPRGSSGSTSSAASAAREFRKRFNSTPTNQDRPDYVPASPFVGSPLTFIDDFGAQGSAVPTTPTLASYRPPSSLPQHLQHPVPTVASARGPVHLDLDLRAEVASSVPSPSPSPQTGRPRGDSIGALYSDNTRNPARNLPQQSRGAVVPEQAPAGVASEQEDPAIMAEEERAYRRKSIVVHGGLFAGQGQGQGLHGQGQGMVEQVAAGAGAVSGVTAGRNSTRLTHLFLGRTLNCPQGSSNTRRGIPTIINWTQGGNNVYVTGTFNGWKHKIRLVKSLGRRFDIGTVEVDSNLGYDGKSIPNPLSSSRLFIYPSISSTQDFTTILDLPPGTHRLKFIVDDEWKCSADLETATDPDGNLVNYVEVGTEDDDATYDFVSPRTDPTTAPHHLLRSSTPPSEYVAQIPSILLAMASQQAESTSPASPSGTAQNQGQQQQQQPPGLPPHLEKVLLNSGAVSEEDNSVLPAPNHVTLNHLYACSIRDGVMAVAGTARYRKKGAIV
ncbi:5'-AMP-activated protein kinase beta subunit, interation domain-containing protein [Jimgerdemannia flammicorona]|uniref:5'-AMP-activated protein kinase beta subunit, interation domain-containing protein n=1 Tax=Jimgerdemannia flammicorona TaxID=994334 RepID=A0A433QJY8_9FUNG|nr:5'-AMP-activated protein kinase beta subunit, interation domain-containing protein [Jimgerdemannia flammicorona]